jgi:hypothetical protein
VNKPPTREAIKPPDLPAAAKQPPDGLPAGTGDVPPPKPPAWNWQLVVFLWATSFAFLALYELLWALLRPLFR